MIKKVGHIGIAVKDLESILEVFCRALGLTKPVIKEFPGRAMRMALINLGPVSLELLEDKSRKGRLARSVSKRGSHLDHFCLLSDDLETDILELEERGITMAQEGSAVGLRGKRVIFALSGLLDEIPVEISEP
jgi:methylmalonyl-CoA/ethylmalonyl-CoA epimerase